MARYAHIAAVGTLVLCLAGAALALSDGSESRYGWADVEGTGNDMATGIFLTDAAAKGAVCLDGSPPAYYFLPGSGDGAKKWYIHHQGGGWCESDEDCYGRSQTQLGSSKSYPKTADLGGGYFSRDPSVNPQMYNWNMVFMRYCDGGSFSGAKTTPTMYQGHELHYTGKFVREAMMADMMQNRGLADATDVVVSGCSAGGLATYLHADQVAALFDEHVTVRALPDSGFFIDYTSPVAGGPNYHAAMQWVFSAMNATSGVNQDCIKAYKATGDTWHCFFAQYTSPHIKTPVFPLQAQYDAWQVPNILGSKDATLINEYGQNFTMLITKYLLDNQPKNGVFLDSCYHHCGEWGDIVIDGDNQGEAFMQFYTYGPQKQTRWEQGQTYPCDACCHGGQ